MNSPLNSILNHKQALALYRTMLVIRCTEERLAKSHQRGLVHGACHTYVGEEAIATGVCANLTSNDVIFSTHRGHGHALAKGVDSSSLIAEIYGRNTGIAGGRGGSMHLFAPEVGLMGTSGIVGPCILQACGGAYSALLKKSGSVSVAFFGDGAVNNGAFHEGINMAAIWKLPVIFVCENNQFATEVSFDYACASGSVAKKADSYEIPGIQVDGNNVVAVYQKTQEAVARARAGEGPTLLECLTYRTRAHAEGMGDFTYRSQEEVEKWKKMDPIATFRRTLINNFCIAEDDLILIRKEVESSVENAHKVSEQSDYPNPTYATTNIYHESNVNTCERPKTKILNSLANNGNSKTREITYMAATLEALTEEMAENPKIFVLGEGVGKRGGNFATTTGLYDKYGTLRLRDTPICERGFVGLACGAAMTGTRPVVDFMIADFLLDAVGEIINQIAKMQYMSSGRLKMPLLMRGCTGIGHSVATHHSGSYYQMFSQVPGLRVLVPSTPFDAKGLLKRALRCYDPVLFMEPRELLASKGPVPEEDYEIEFGKASIVCPGEDVTVIAIGYMVQHAIKAAQHLLVEENLLVEVIDPRTVSPLDTQTILNSVSRTGKLLIVDETPAECGVSAEIAASISEKGFDELDAPIKRLNGAFTPTPYSPSLEASVVPNVDSVVDAIRELMNE